MDRSGRSSRVDELDGLRGLLASWVAVAHIFCWCGFANARVPDPFVPIWHDFALAMPAVETFMILSGFAISFLLHSRGQSYAGFIRGRFFRIYPTYLACLLFGVATILLTPSILRDAPWHQDGYFRNLGMISRAERADLIPHLIAHLTLLNGLIPEGFLALADSTLLPPAWSITLEWQYYLAAPGIARASRSAWLVLVVGVVACWGAFESHMWKGSLSFLPSHLAMFLVGIASFHLHEALSRSGGPPPRSAVPVAAALVAIWLFSTHAVALTIWAVGFGCVLVDGTGPEGWALRQVRRGLLDPRLQWLGRVSYPLYLVHWPMIVVGMSLLLRARPGVGQAEALAWMLGLAFPAILLAAWLIHVAIEVPSMRLGKSRPSN